MNDIEDSTEGTAYSVISGDMYDWSDLTSARALPRGPVLTRFAVATAEGASHLVVVGPHDLGLLDAVVGRASRTTIVLRAHRDAELVAERYAERPVDVVCGDLLAWKPEHPADAVLALDGFSRVATIDADPAGWRGFADHVAVIAAQESRLALVVPNPGSVLEQLRTVAEEASNENEDWSFPVHDRTIPRSLADATALFGGQGYTVWPEPSSPTLAATAESCSPALAIAHGRPTTPTLRELQPALGQALDALGAAAVASGWLVTRGLDEIPAVLGVDRIGNETGSHAAQESWLIEAMRDSARRDAPGLRRRVGRLHAAVVSEPERWAGVQVDEIGLDADRITPLHDSTVKLGNTADEITAGLLDELAAFICRAGWRHPWPAGSGRDELATLLAGTVDLALTPADVRRLREQRESALVSAGMVPVVATSSSGADRSELQKLADENEALRGQVAWFKQQMRQRQTMTHEVRTRAQRDAAAQTDRIRQLENQVAELQSTPMNRAAKRAATVPARARARAGRVRGARRGVRLMRRILGRLRRAAQPRR